MQIGVLVKHGLQLDRYRVGPAIRLRAA